MASDDLLRQLKKIAQDEEISFAQVIREGLELRVKQANEPPRFIASVASAGSSGPTARESSDRQFEPPPWR